MPNLLIDIEARFAQFQDSLNSVKRSSEQAARGIEGAFQSLNKTVKTLGGAFLAYKAAGFVKNIVTAADELHTIHERTDIAIDDLAGLKFVAEQTGASFEDLTGGLKKLSKAISEAGSGDNKELKRLFEHLGMKEAAAGAISAKEAFLQLADIFPRLKGVDQTRVAMDFMGRSADALLPAFKNGRAGIEQMLAKSKQMNPEITALAKASDDFGDKLNELATAFKGALAPAITPALEKITEFITKVNSASLAAGGLFKLLRSSLTLNDFDDPGAKLADLEERLSRLRKTREGIEKSFSHQSPLMRNLPLIGTQSDLDDLAQLEKRLTAERDILLEAQAQREEANASPPPGKGKKGPLALPPKDLGDREKALLEQRLKDAERAIDAEQRSLEQFNDAIEALYEDNLISLRDYIDGKTQAQDQALAASLRAYDAEIRALEAFRKKADPKEKTETDTRIAEAQAKRAQLIQQTALAGIKLAREETKETKELERAVADLNIQLLERQGLSGVAVGLRFDQSSEDLRKKLIAAGRTDDVNKLDHQREQVVLDGQLKDLADQTLDIRERLSFEEDRARTSAQLGAIGELESLKRVSSARASAVDQLRSVVAAYEAIAAASDDPRVHINALRMRKEFEELAATADLVRDRFQHVFDDALSAGLDELVEGTHRVDKAFEAMAKSIVRSLNQIAIQEISGSIFGKDKAGGWIPELLQTMFTGGSTSGGAGVTEGLDGTGGDLQAGGGNWLSLIGKLITTGFFHGGGIAGDAGTFARAVSPLAFAGAPRFHIGGIAGDEIPIVAKKGEGIFTERQMAKLAPIDRIARAGGGGLVMNIYTQDANSFRASEDQILQRMNLAARRAARRNM